MGQHVAMNPCQHRPDNIDPNAELEGGHGPGLSESADQNGVPGGAAARTQQPSITRPGEVNQFVPVEMGHLRWRSARERLTPDVANAVRVHYIVERFTIRTPGERRSRAWRRLERREASHAVCLAHSQHSVGDARIFPWEMDACDLLSIRGYARNGSRLRRNLLSLSSVDGDAPNGRLAANAGSPVRERRKYNGSPIWAHRRMYVEPPVRQLSGFRAVASYPPDVRILLEHDVAAVARNDQFILVGGR